jgi:hypothetical protein
VQEIQVKSQRPTSYWIWGAFRLPGATFLSLHQLWEERQGGDEYLGTLVNAHLARGGRAAGVRDGQAYVDTGTLHGYHEAMILLRDRAFQLEGIAGGGSP